MGALFVLGQWLGLFGNRPVTVVICSIDKPGLCRTWVKGTVDIYRFEALVYPLHASVGSYELGRSRISKLHLVRLGDETTVFEWDRGLGMPPQGWRVQRAIRALSARLAEQVYGS